MNMTAYEKGFEKGLEKGQREILRMQIDERFGPCLVCTTRINRTA
jgi:hypothetical protein